jgi:hypothetical protein
MNAVRLSRALLAVAVLASGAVAAAPAASAHASSTPTNVSISANGPAATIAFPAGSPNATVTIMGLTTQQLSIQTAKGAFASRCDLKITLVDPDGDVLAGPKCAGKSTTLSVTALPEAGNYSVQMIASATGSVRVSASSAGGPSSITPNAAALTLIGGLFGFVAHAGERYSVVATGQVLKARHCSVQIRFVDSSTNQVGPYTAGCSYPTGFVDATTIPADGTYFIQVSRTHFSGDLDVALFKVPADQTGTILTNGVPVNLNLNTPGQHARFTFKGVVGNRISFLLISTQGALLTLIRPDGTQPESGGETTGGFLEPFTIDQAGTWTIVVDPTAPNATGTLQRWTVVDQTGTADLSGTPVNLKLEPGQNAEYTFSGTVGQEISVYLGALNETCNSCSACWIVTVLRPDASVFETTCDNGGANGGFLDRQALDQAGTWTVVVDPLIGSYGTAALQIANVVDQTGAAAFNTPTTVNLAAPSENARYTFSGTAGDKTAVAVTTSSIAEPCLLSVLRPDSSVFTTESCSSPTALQTPPTLDQTGMWTVVIDPQGPQTGSVTFQITNVVDQTGAITPGGPSVALDLETPYQNAEYTFSGATGDTRTVSIKGSSFPGCSSIFVSLLRPDGSTLAIKGTCGATLTLGPDNLDATGTWTVFVDPQGTGTGTAMLKLT